MDKKVAKVPSVASVVSPFVGSSITDQSQRQDRLHRRLLQDPGLQTEEQADPTGHERRHHGAIVVAQRAVRRQRVRATRRAKGQPRRRLRFDPDRHRPGARLRLVVLDAAAAVGRTRRRRHGDRGDDTPQSRALHRHLCAHFGFAHRTGRRYRLRPLHRDENPTGIETRLESGRRRRHGHQHLGSRGALRRLDRLHRLARHARPAALVLERRRHRRVPDRADHHGRVPDVPAGAARFLGHPGLESKGTTRARSNTVPSRSSRTPPGNVGRTPCRAIRANSRSSL